MKKEDIQKFCRICASKFEKKVLSLTPIFQEQEKCSEQIQDRINTCLPVSVFKDDGLPQQICTDCRKKVNIAYNISQCSVQAEQTLRHIKFKSDAKAKLSNNGCNNIKVEKCEPPNFIPNIRLQNVRNSVTSTSQGIEVLGTQMQSKILPKLQDMRVSPPKIAPLKPGSAIAVIVAEKTKKKNLTLRIVLVPKDNSSVPVSLQVAQAIKFHKQRIQERKKELQQQVVCSTLSESDPCNILVCTVCDVTFLTKQDKLSHFIDIHPENTLKCPKCKNTVCGTSELISKHLKYHEEKQIKAPFDVDSRLQRSENSKLKANIVNLGEYDPNLPKQKAAIQALKILTKATDHPGIKQDMKPQVMIALRKFLTNDQPRAIGQQLGENITLKVTCTICLQKFPTKTGLYKHLVKLHRPRVEHPECLHCNKTLRLYCTESHLKKKHAVGKYLLCRTCDTAYAKTGAEQSHMLLAPQIHCTVPTCNEYFSTSELLNKHAYDIHGISKYYCDHCGKSFKTHASITSHILNQHINKEGTVCHICGKELTTASGLKTHIKNMHTVQEQCICDICGKTVSKYALRSHIFNHFYYSQKRECASCHKILKIKAWKRHKKYHAKHGPDSLVRKGRKTYSADKKEINPKQRIECVICHKFYRRDYLKIHMKYHFNQKDFECAVCNKKYACKSALTWHIQEVHLKSGHHCQYCSKYFYRKGSLLAHEALHRGERNFKCPHCPKFFPGKRNVQCHIWQVHKDMRKPKLNIVDVSKNVVQISASEFDPAQFAVIEKTQYMIPDVIVEIDTGTCEIPYKANF